MATQSFDPAREILVRLARDLATEIEDEDPRWGDLVPISPLTLRPDLVQQHSLHDEFLRLVTSDDHLAAIFKEGFISSNTGRGWRVQVETFAAAFLNNAAGLVVLQEGDPRDSAILAAQVAADCDAFAQLIEGKEVEARTFLALEGLTLSSSVDLPWGLLRPVTAVSRRIMAFGFAPSAFLEIPTLLRYQVGEPNDEPDADSPEFERHTQRVSRAAKLLPLASVLASRRSPPVAPRVGWWTTPLPGSLGSGYSITGRRARAVVPELGRVPVAVPGLTDKEVADLAEWAQVVESRFHDSIDVAVRRTLLAILEREDPADALIDAVIALENLFGHGGTTEVTFRVTSAIAILLEQPSERESRRKNLKEILNLRSRVVHGDDYIVDNNFINKRDEAVTTTINVLRRLFQEAPELLPERDRGMRLVLGS